MPYELLGKKNALNTFSKFKLLYRRPSKPENSFTSNFNQTLNTRQTTIISNDNLEKPKVDDNCCISFQCPKKKNHNRALVKASTTNPCVQQYLPVWRDKLQRFQQQAEDPCPRAPRIPLAYVAYPCCP